jgi:hypothetical protein
MKKLLLILSVGLLSGCSTLNTLYDSYFMAKYDTNEYALVNAVKTKSIIAQADCNDRQKTVDNVKKIYEKSYEFRNFAFHIPRNKDAQAMSEKLLKLTTDTKEYYQKNEKVSDIFCKSRYQQIARAADTIQSTLGSKPR